SRRDRATTLQFWASVKPGIRRRTACKPKPAIPKRIIIGLTVLVLKRHSTFVLHARKMTPRGRSLCGLCAPFGDSPSRRQKRSHRGHRETREAQGKAGSDGLRGDQRFRNSASKVGSMLPPLITTTLIFVLGN